MSMLVERKHKSLPRMLMMMEIEYNPYSSSYIHVYDQEEIQETAVWYRELDSKKQYQVL